VLVVVALTVGIPLTLAVVAHEGSTLLVAANGLRLLARRPHPPLAESRPWARYFPDYHPLVEEARSRGWAVVAANVPRALANRIAQEGLAVLPRALANGLEATERRHAAAEISCPDDDYRRRFVEEMTRHPSADTTDAEADARRQQRFYEAQCVKDETMAEAIAAATATGAVRPVVHVTGSFHSDYGDGIPVRLLRREPDLDVVSVTIVTVADLDAADPAPHLDRADYLLFTLATPTAERPGPERDCGDGTGRHWPLTAAAAAAACPCRAGAGADRACRARRGGWTAGLRCDNVAWDRQARRPAPALSVCWCTQVRIPGGPHARLRVPLPRLPRDLREDRAHERARVDPPRVPALRGYQRGAGLQPVLREDGQEKLTARPVFRQLDRRRPGLTPFSGQAAVALAACPAAPPLLQQPGRRLCRRPASGPAGRPQLRRRR
jgi:hypothetical protein